MIQVVAFAVFMFLLVVPQLAICYAIRPKGQGFKEWLNS